MEWGRRNARLSDMWISSFWSQACTSHCTVNQTIRNCKHINYFFVYESSVSAAEDKRNLPQGRARRPWRWYDDGDSSCGRSGLPSEPTEGLWGFPHSTALPSGSEWPSEHKTTECYRGTEHSSQYKHVSRCYTCLWHLIKQFFVVVFNRFYSGNVVLQFIFCRHITETHELCVFAHSWYVCLHIHGFDQNTK